MSDLNQPNKYGSNFLSSTVDDDDIELDENIVAKSKEDQQSVNSRLIPQSNISTADNDESINSTAKKKPLVVRLEELSKFRQFLHRMSQAKNISFILVLVVSIVITFLITKYAINATNSNSQNCQKDKDTHQDSPRIANKTVRLSTDIVPINYDLKIQPFMRTDQFQFNGSVLITIACKKATNQIQLNANQLEIDFRQIVVSKSNGESDSNIKIKKHIMQDEVITLELEHNLTPITNYTIDMPFKGNLSNSLAGFYRSSYIDNQTNETRYLAMTQFQATDARRAFPCMDEPSFKATFDIEITHWSNMTAISNMPVKDFINLQNGWSITKFDRTVMMSTYLVAFAVGDFRFKEQENKKSVPQFRIATRPSAIEQANEAIRYGPAILKNFENYFDIPFPLPKIDMLACPDFSAGAMEVTPEWWSDIWLNEGFATYMSYVGIDSVQPNWKIFDIFVLEEIHDVLAVDSMKNSHPISVEVNDPNEISELFDYISYAKGASIIRMMTYIIGQDTFKLGIHNYLQAKRLSNANQNDLWMHLQKASDLQNGKSTVNVKQVMDSWTIREGYPLVTIIRDYSKNKIHFSQQRFMLNAGNQTNLTQIQYEIPLSYTWKSESNWKPEIKLWLHMNPNATSTTEIQLNIPKKDWFIANIQQIGFFRVTYDQENWNLLIDQLHHDHTKISRVNRAQILNDLFHLAGNDMVSYRDALRALEYLKKEDDPLVLSTIEFNTYLISRMLRRTDSYGEWQQYIRELVEPSYNFYKLDRLGDDDLEANRMQKVIVRVACGYNLPNCVELSKKLFQEFMNNTSRNNIPPNVRASVYCSAIHHGDEKEWNFVFDLYLKEQNANEKIAMLSALTCSRVPWILSRYLKWSLDESSGIKSQDALLVFKGVATSNYGKDIAFNFMRENWNRMYEIHGQKMSFGNIVKTLGSLNSEFELDLIKSFYRNVRSKLGTASRAFLQTIEQIQSNILWMKNYENQISKFLAERKSKN